MCINYDVDASDNVFRTYTFVKISAQKTMFRPRDTSKVIKSIIKM